MISKRQARHGLFTIIIRKSLVYFLYKYTEHLSNCKSCGQIHHALGLCCSQGHREHFRWLRMDLIKFQHILEASLTSSVKAEGEKRMASING